MDARPSNWFTRLCVEPIQHSRRLSRLAKLRIKDREAYLRFIGAAGKVLLCHLSPYAGDRIDITATDGHPDLTYDQPPIVLPQMAWDRVAIAFAASAAMATRTRTGVCKNTHWSPGMFERTVPPTRIEDGIVIANEDLSLAPRLARTIVGPVATGIRSDGQGRRILPTPAGHHSPPPWEEQGERDYAFVIDKIYGDTDMPMTVRAILATAYARAVHVCDILHRKEVERLAALLYDRSKDGLLTTEDQIRPLLGARPDSRFRSAASP